MSTSKDFYKKLQTQLDDTTCFPADYLYKFIVPTDENQVAAVEAVFADVDAAITIKKSKTGKYNSVSIVINLASSKEVISYYHKVEKIKGIISL